MCMTAFGSLHEISIANHGERGGLFGRHGRTCWFLYSPALELTGSRKDWRIFCETNSDSLILYRVRATADRLSAQILTPPVPCTPRALDHAIARVREMTARSTVRIRHVERRELASVARAGFALRLRDEEFLYDAADLISLEGPGLKRVRREISKTRAHSGLSIRDYLPGDEAGCREVLDRWRRRMVEADLPVEGFRMIARCLRRAPGWGRDLIRGRVCEMHGEIRGFSFGGPISPACCNMFICIADVDLRGLSYLMRHDMVLQWPDHPEFNMGNDAGRPGLRSQKEAFRPARIAPIFGAVLS
jgi:hypothetical protein